MRVCVGRRFGDYRAFGGKLKLSAGMKEK